MANQMDRINNICLIIIASILLTAGLIYTKAALLPFVISLFCYVVMAPLILFFQVRARLPRLLATVVVLLIVSVISVSVFFLISSSLENFFLSAGLYRDRILDFMTWLSKYASDYGFNLDVSSIRRELQNLPVFQLARNLTGSLLEVFGNFLLIVVYLLFLIASDSGVKANKDEENHPIIKEMQIQISKYLGIKVLISLVTGTLVGLILGILKVDLALMFAILAFLLNFIPNIGSVIATILPIPIVLLQYGFGPEFYISTILCSVIQFVSGNVIEPKMTGDSMDLHPITTLVFLIFWGLVWGVPGMFLAVPITAVIRLVLLRLDTTKAFAELLSGRLPKFKAEHNRRVTDNK